MAFPGNQSCPPIYCSFERTPKLFLEKISMPAAEPTPVLTSDPESRSIAANAGSGLPPTLVENVAALAGGTSSSIELTERSLDRIAASQPTLNAFRVVCAESARAAAADADRRLAAGERLPLLGVPVAIKDDVDLEGHPTAFGCAGDFPCKTADSEVVRRLRSAGAVIVGKANTPEVGLYPFTEGAAFGVTRNPWNLDHTPGGSSGGGAAAVAAGIVAAAVGSDGAGSVRIPAAWCGLVGVKPQRGRISSWPDAESFNGLSCLGPLTRTVADAALILDVLSGPHPGDLHLPPRPPVPFLEAACSEPGKLRIALSLRHPFSAAPVKLDAEVRAAILRISEVLAGLGHEVIEADPHYGLMGLTLAIRGQAAVHEWTANVPDRGSLDPRTREAARVGALLERTLLPAARRAEPRLARRVGSIFDDVDVVLTPTTATPPLRVGATAGLGGWATDQIMVGACPYAWPWNVLGWPGVSVPAGLTQEGLPIGAQLLGPANAEGKLLALANQLEQVERWHEHVAPSAADTVQAR
jgi:amidase